MGIETFFSALATTTRRKNIIKEFTGIHGDAIFFDFNSIIHRVSQQFVDDINRAMRALFAGNATIARQICEKYVAVCPQAKSVVSGDTNPATLSAIDTKETVIKLVISTTESYIGHATYVFIAIDGVPGYGKMREQKHRRYLGEVSAAATKK